MKNIGTKWLLIGLALIMAGCGAKKDPTPQTTVRILNLAPENGALSVQTGSNLEISLFTGVAYQAASAYSTFDAGNVRFRITDPASTLSDSTPTFAGNAKNTVVVYGGTASLGTTLLTNPGSAPGNAAKFNLRLANFGAGALGLDVYVIKADQDIAQLQPDIRGVTARGISNYVELDSGSRIIKVTETGNKDVLFEANATTFAEKINHTLVAYSAGSNRLVNAVLLQDDDVGAVTVLNNKYARVRGINGASDSGPVILKNGATTLFANMPYQGGSDYTPVQVGTAALRFEQASTPGTATATVTQELKGGMDYSLVLRGSVLGNNASILSLSDANLPPASGKARVLFVNATTGVGAVDIFANFASVKGNLAAGAVAAVEVTPGNIAYSVNPANASAAILSLPTTEIKANTIYTIFIVGQTGAVNGVIRQGN